MAIISLNHESKLLSISETTFDHPLIFAYFSGLPASNRDEAFKCALQIGVVALMEDRIAFRKSQSTRLQSLKVNCPDDA